MFYHSNEVQSSLSLSTTGAPLGLSNPHFLYGSKDLQESVEGLSPNVSLHENFFQVEPVSMLHFKSHCSSVTFKIFSNSKLSSEKCIFVIILNDMCGHVKDQRSPLCSLPYGNLCENCC